MIDQRQHIIGKLIPYTFDQITIDNTSGGKSITSANINASPKPKKVIITIETAQIRYTIDGTAPTSSVGHLCNPFDVIVLEGYSQIQNFKAIRAGGTSATISISYLR